MKSKVSFKPAEYPYDSYDQAFGYFVMVKGKKVGFIIQGEEKHTWYVHGIDYLHNKNLPFKTRKAAAEWILKTKFPFKEEKVSWIKD